MSDSPRIIESLKPIKRHPAIVNWTDSAGKVNWSLRPFWIIEDLRIMHDWMNSNRALCNRPVDRERLPLILHYIQLLQSATQQALVLARNGVVVGQFDIVKQVAEGEGFCINFNFPDEPGSPKYWQIGVLKLVEILVKEIHGNAIYIEVPANYFSLIALAEEMGYIVNQRYPLLSKEMCLFKIK